MRMYVCLCLNIFYLAFHKISSQPESNLAKNGILKKFFNGDARRGIFDSEMSQRVWRAKNTRGEKMSKLKQMDVKVHPHQAQAQSATDDLYSHTTLKPFALRRQLDRLLTEIDSNVTIEVLGKTVEFNEILLMKMALKDDRFRTNDPEYDKDTYKKVVFIVHCLDTAGMNNLPAFTKISFFKDLLSYYEKYLEKFDIFLIPIANPDGASKGVQYWHKNMSPQGPCFGVHLDRNFDIAFKTQDKNSCGSYYSGPSAFSEPESRAVKEVMHRYSNRIVGYLNVHASSDYSDVHKGDAVLYPKGYTETVSNDDKYMDLRSDIDEALKNASFRNLVVDVEPLVTWYGKIGGSSVDYASVVYGVPYSLELCMQFYQGHYKTSLTQVWRRVINVIFNNIIRGLKL